MKLKTVCWWALAALILFAVISNPPGAAEGVHSGLSWLADAANGILRFIGNVVS